MGNPRYNATWNQKNTTGKKYQMLKVTSIAEDQRD